MKMPETTSFYSVGDAARRIGARPNDISTLLYNRELRDDLCPIVGGRRLIPVEYLPAIIDALRKRGKRVDAPAIAPRPEGGSQ